MLGDAETPDDRGVAGLAVDVGGGLEIGGGNPGDLLDSVRRVALEQLLELLVALGLLVDEGAVDEPVAAHDVAEAEHHRGVGARTRREVQHAVVGELDPPRVDRDELAARAASPA